MKKDRMTYADAGVDVELGNEASKVLYNAAKLTWDNRKGLGEVIEINPDFAKPLIEQEEESMIDMAQGQLYKQIQKGEGWSIKYLLATKGKKRGFTEKQEVELSGEVDNNVTINIIQPK